MGIGLSIEIKVSTNFLCRQTQFDYAKTKTLMTVRYLATVCVVFETNQALRTLKSLDSEKRFRNNFSFREIVSETILCFTAL